ncbi:MAG: hypothetical protein KatS3mg002_1245 [Candidatus Woesearchaeota archaeon]|nr:MAG: hypothetical protein KatS3mg002_1245 [Candidatus Woesearchaeota archaeon]
MSAFVCPPDKYFYTIDKRILSNLHQLSSYLKSCSIENFNYHVNNNKNDFYMWINLVFELKDLSEKIKNIRNPLEMSKEIDRFLDSQIMISSNNSKNEHSDSKNFDNDIESNINKKSSESVNNISQINNKENVNDVNNIFENKDNNSDSKNNSDSVKEKFHEFTDEELEKFAKFGVKENEMVNDEKLDYLKTMAGELRNNIKDLRRSGKDLIIAELMMRVVEPKISYYGLTKKQEDYEKALMIMNDIKREIDYASQQNEVTLADEIIKQLEIQSVMLKKDFTPKKQSVLDKIFKRKEQEV